MYKPGAFMRDLRYLSNRESEGGEGESSRDNSEGKQIRSTENSQKGQSRRLCTLYLWGPLAVLA